MPRSGVLVATALVLAACSRSGDASRGATPPPSRSGTVWETDGVRDRGAAAATMLAYVNGLHVIVLDGEDVFAGMTRLHATATPDGGHTVALANGLTAQMVPAGDALELRFSSGETVRMRKRESVQ